jgi:hypothetical protein
MENNEWILPSFFQINQGYKLNNLLTYISYENSPDAKLDGGQKGGFTGKYSLSLQLLHFLMVVPRMYSPKYFLTRLFLRVVLVVRNLEE